MILYIIRHGHPDYETDTLTELGWKQAEAVGKRIARTKVDRIFSSPMGRARQTAEPACRLLGLEYTVQEWMREITPEEQTTTYPDGAQNHLCEMPNTLARGTDEFDLPFDRAFEARALAASGMKERYDYIRARSDEFLENLGYKAENGVYRIVKPSDEKVAVFCHALFGMTWISAMMRIPFQMMWTGFCYSHTGVTMIEFENHADGRTAPKILSYCDLSHIYAEGLPMLYDNWKPI